MITDKIRNNSQATPTWGIKPHLEGVSQPHLVSNRDKESYLILSHTTFFPILPQDWV